MGCTRPSSRSPGRLLASSADLNRAETVDAAVSRAIELTEAAFEEPEVRLCEYDAATDTFAFVGPAAPSSGKGDHEPAGTLASVFERAGERPADQPGTAVPESTVDSDPREDLQAEAFVPVGQNRVLCIGLPSSDGFDEAAVDLVEGIAANLETVLARLEPGRTKQPGTGDRLDDDATALRRLNELTCTSTDFDDTIERLLSLGCDYFGLDTGIVSHVEDGDYEVEAVVDATDTHEAGAMYDLGETMCQATLSGGRTEPLAFADVTETEHRDHPAADGVCAYIAAPVFADGEPYGTVNFSMGRPRAGPFRSEEREFVTLVAEWVGAEVERRRRFEQLEQYETILEAVDDPVYALDTDGRFTFVNDAAEREFGYGEEILGEHVSVGMDEADVERIRGQIEELLGTDERSTTAEFELRTGRTERRVVENRLALIGDGDFRGTAGVLRDITSRRERERELESFQRAVEEAADGVAILDGDEYVYVDQTHVDMYGFDTKDQLLGETWRKLYDDEEATRLETEVFPALEEDGHWQGMVTGSRPDGSTFPAELSLTIIDDGRLVCTVRDETERRARERELELKERAMNEATVGIQITDATRDGNPLVYVNDGFQRMTGYTSEEAIGRNPRFLQGEDSDPEQVARLREAIDSEEPVSLELQNNRKDGTPYWSRISITPVTDDEGTVTNYVGIQQDVTERRKRQRDAERRVELLKRLYAVTTDPQTTFEEKIAGLLEAGGEYLDLPYGFLTQIEMGDGSSDGEQKIVEAVGDHERLQSGATGPLSQSYCQRTINQDDVVAIADASESELVEDTAYERFGLETYVGGNVVVDGETYGTLCFASNESRDETLNEFEKSFLTLLGQWAGYEIERRDAREELSQQRERLELTLSGTNTGITEWDLETDELTSDDTFVDLVGRDADTADEFFETVIHPDDRERVEETLSTNLAAGEPTKTEYRVQTDDESTRWLQSRAVQTYDDDGNQVTVLAIVTDISDRKAEERGRRRNERRFESLFEDPEMLVGLLDTDGTLLDANTTAMEYIGGPAGALRGEPFWEAPWWSHSDELQDDVREWIRRAADGEYVEYSAPHRTPDGDRFYVDGTIRPVTDSDGTVTSLLVSARDVTEREEQRQELEDRQRKLDLVLSNTDTSVAELDPVNGTVRWDEMAGENELGSPETLEAFFETVHPEDRERVRSAVEGMAGGDGPLSIEFRFVEADDSVVWVAAEAVPVTDGTGEPTGELVGIATDITDQKAREQALADSQQRYETLLQAAPDPVFVADAETGEIVEANAAAEEIRGQSRAELVGLQQTELHPDDDRELYRDAFDRSVGSTRMISELADGTQPKLCDSDGEPVPVEINASSVQLPDGAALYGVFRDVSERRQRERELELKERAMDEANLGITISDPDQADNPLIYANDGFVDQTGYTREDAIGRNCRFLQADDRDQAALDTLRDAIAAEEPTTVELRNYRKDGEQFWNRLSVTPVYDDDGTLANYIGVQQDVTEAKDREQQLRALHGTTRELLGTDDEDEAVRKALDTLSVEFDFHVAGIYLREVDELVKTGTVGPAPGAAPERVERGRTPLWKAIDAGEPVVIDDYSALDDDVERGDTARGAYVPIGEHGVIVVGTADSARLDESEQRLVEILAGNLASLLDTFDREESLRASRERYRSLAKNIPNGAVLTFDEDLKYVLAAGELISAFGFGESDISGETVGTVLADGEHELIPRFRAALDGDRTDRRIELRDRVLRVHITPIEADEESAAGDRGIVLVQDVTEEANREQALFEEREQFRLLTESVDEYAFLTVDEDGTVQTWNAGAETLFGYDADTALGMPMAEFHPESERGSGLADRLLQQARVAGESAHEGWRVRADGSEFYADVRYAALESDDGEFRGYAKVVRDMTDRRRQQRRTERFVEEANDVVTIVDTDGTIEYASGSADRILGYDPDDLAGENLFDHLHPESREGAMETFFDAMENPDANPQVECRIRSGDDEWLNVEGQCRNMRDDDAVGGMLLYLRDVTEERERARRFESIFNQTFQFTGLLEPDGTVVEVNDAALDFGEVERDKIVGVPFFDVPWWTHSEAVRNDVRNAIERAAAGEFVRYETEVRGGEGLATIDFSVKPVTDEDDEVSLLVVEGRDITARQQQRRHLEVMQRVMRHNMRNDLTKIRGWTDAMAAEPDAAERADQLEVIEEILDKWEGMTGKMKDIRRTFRMQNDEWQAKEADSLLEAAVAPLREAHGEATISIETLDAESIEVPETLLKGIRELVDNAVSAKADATVEVELARPEPGWLELRVRDDGPGIPEMEAEVLETGEETALTHGQGLGLWMVRMIVTQAGGDVSVTSTSEGTDVRLRLPSSRRFRTDRPVETP